MILTRPDMAAVTPDKLQPEDVSMFEKILTGADGIPFVGWLAIVAAVILIPSLIGIRVGKIGPRGQLVILIIASVLAVLFVLSLLDKLLGLGFLSAI